MHRTYVAVASSRVPSAVSYSFSNILSVLPPLRAASNTSPLAPAGAGRFVPSEQEQPFSPSPRDGSIAHSYVSSCSRAESHPSNTSSPHLPCALSCSLAVLFALCPLQLPPVQLSSSNYEIFSWKARPCAHIHAHASCSIRSVTRIYDGGSSPAITFIFPIALSNYARLVCQSDTRFLLYSSHDLPPLQTCPAPPNAPGCFFWSEK